jgi:hypothetical protein
VDIQPYEHATVAHDLPPCVWPCVTPSDAPHNPRCDKEVGLCCSGATSARARRITRRPSRPPQERGPRRAAVE